MSATYGQQSRAPFASYDPEACSWRTLQATLFSDSEPFSETWPRSGMTLNGSAYALPMPRLVMVEPACSSSRVIAMLPTPTGDDANNVTRKSGSFTYLTRAVQLLGDRSGQPSADGSASLDALLLDLLTTEDD